MWRRPCDAEWRVVCRRVYLWRGVGEANAVRKGRISAATDEPLLLSRDTHTRHTHTWPAQRRHRAPSRGRAAPERDAPPRPPFEAAPGSSGEGPGRAWVMGLGVRPRSKSPLIRFSSRAVCLLVLLFRLSAEIGAVRAGTRACFLRYMQTTTAYTPCVYTEKRLSVSPSHTHSLPSRVHVGVHAHQSAIALPATHRHDGRRDAARGARSDQRRKGSLAQTYRICACGP
jgi:hypothetical protein